MIERIKSKLKNKKGHEEMVGFIVIVVIVTFIAIILFLLSLRKPAGIESSQEIENFLHASTYFTTECEIAGEILNLKKLIIACFNRDECDNGGACELLNQTLSELVNVWETSQFSGYNLKVYAVEDDDTTGILELKQGEETLNSQAGDAFFPYSGKRFHIYLKVFY